MHSLSSDGFSPLQGDCNDRWAAVHPGAPERLRNVDDDCDGRVDDKVWPWPLAPWVEGGPAQWHAYLSAISRCSHARATAHSRLTVAGEIPSTSATSVTSRPAKKRSSTTRLCRGSSSSSRVSASSRA